jgi:hypothetical protein
VLARSERQPVAEQADLLGARRFLELVVTLGDGEVPGHEASLFRREIDVRSE